MPFSKQRISLPTWISQTGGQPIRAFMSFRATTVCLLLFWLLGSFFQGSLPTPLAHRLVCFYTQRQQHPRLRVVQWQSLGCGRTCKPSILTGHVIPVRGAKLEVERCDSFRCAKKLQAMHSSSLVKQFPPFTVSSMAPMVKFNFHSAALTTLYGAGQARAVQGHLQVG